MDANARQKKIEAGKQTLAKFVKKRRKRKATSEISSSESVGNSLSSRNSFADVNMVEDPVTSDIVVSEHNATDDEASSRQEAEEETEQSVHTDGCDIPTVDNIDDIVMSYRQKLQKFQEAINQRDQVIYQLSSRLEVAIEAQKHVHLESGSEMEAMASEINVLKQQLQQAIEVLERQRNKSEISVREFLEVQNKSVALEVGNHQKDLVIEKQKRQLHDLENQIQSFKNAKDLCVPDVNTVDKSVQISIFDSDKSIQTLENETVVNIYVESSCQVDFDDFVDLSEFENLDAGDFISLCEEKNYVSSIERTLFSKFACLLEERDALRCKVQQLEEMQLFSAPVDHAAVQTSESEKSNATRSFGSHLDLPVNNALKQLLCINAISKVVESYLRTSSASMSCDRTSELSSQIQNLSEPSNSSLPHSANQVHFNRNFEIPDQNRSLVGGFNNFNNLFSHSSVLDASLEVFRSQGISQNLSSLREFLQAEANSCCSQLSTYFHDDRLMSQTLPVTAVTDDVNKMANVEEEVVDSGANKSLTDLKVMYEIYSQEKLSLEQSFQQLARWEELYMDDHVKSELSGSEHLTINVEDLSSSCLTLTSSVDNENVTNITLVADDNTVNIPDTYNHDIYLGSNKDTQYGSGALLCVVHEEAIEQSERGENQECVQNQNMHDSDLNVIRSEEKLSSSSSEESLRKQELHGLQEKLLGLERERTELLSKVAVLEETLKETNSKINEFLEQKLNLGKSIEHFISEHAEDQFLTEFYGPNSETCNSLEGCIVFLESLVTHLQSKHKTKIDQLTQELHTKCDTEKELSSKISDLEECSNSLKQNLLLCEDQKLKIECDLANQIADLVDEHNEELKTQKLDLLASFDEKMKKLSDERVFSDSEHDKVHQLEIENIFQSFQDEKQKMKQDFEAQHAAEVNVYQRKVETLLEEKCVLLTRSKEEFEKIIKRNQQSLKELCHLIQRKISEEREKMEISSLSTDVSFEKSFVETLDDLSKKIQNGVDAFFKQNHLPSCELPPIFHRPDTDIFPERLESSNARSAESIIEMQDLIGQMKEMHEAELHSLKEQHKRDMESIKTCQENIDVDHIQNLIMIEMSRVKDDFEEKLLVYKEENEKLASELISVTNKLSLLEEYNQNLKTQLGGNLKELGDEKSTDLVDSVRKSVTCPSSSSSFDIRSWQVHAAQTNSRLLHVLSDLVKTFLDIEHDINARLTEYGIGGHNESSGHDDDNGQSVGSREDFTAVSPADHHNLDLTEDGPDLTPRAWDLFVSVGAYDADIEGEDVVIGASRRLRSAVDQILNLLSLILDKPKDNNFKALVRRNEELSHELQEESEGKDNLQLHLINARSLIRKFEIDKHRLEDELFNIREEKELLCREVLSLKSKISSLEEEKEISYEERKQLREQCAVLTSKLDDPGKRPCRTENLLHEIPELLQENMKLSTEKLAIQRNLTKEKQNLLSRVQQLEMSLEEVTSMKDDIIDNMRRDNEDLKNQIESIEKQLLSNKKFIDEQVAEREQEREEYCRELKMLTEMLREKDKTQNMEAHLTKETECLEQQLKAKIEEHKSAISKKEELENELRQALDKINDLREVISELEKQLDVKARNEAELKEAIGSMSRSLSVHEQTNADLQSQLDDCNGSEILDESIEQMRNMKEQLESKQREIEQLSQSDIMLQELRGQIHFLEAKVDQKTRQIESQHLVSIISPVLSDDASYSDPHDVDHPYIPCNDGWEMSPRSVHWMEIRRLEEKIGRLLHINEELLKQNKDFTTQIQKLKEDCHEKEILQQQVTTQMLEICALKSDIEEHKHRTLLQIDSHAAYNHDQLKQSLEKEQEFRKQTANELAVAKDQLREVKEQLLQRNELIQKLHDEHRAHIKDAPGTSATVSKESQMTMVDSSYICPVCATGRQAEDVLKENEILLGHLSKASERVAELEHLLENSRRELENEKIQVEMLIEEGYSSRSQHSKTDIEKNKSHMAESTDGVITELQEKNNELSSLLSQTRDDLARSEMEVSVLKANIVELKAEAEEAQRNLENEQMQLEKDFNTVQEMMQRKEAELSTLQEETENQLRLEAEIDSLHNLLEKQKETENELHENLKLLQQEVDDVKSRHANDLKQLVFLKSGLYLFDDVEDIDVKEVQEKITEAAQVLSKSEDDTDSFNQVVFRMLQQFVDIKAKNIQEKHDKKIEETHKSWQEKLREGEQNWNASKNKLECDIINLKKKHKMEMKTLNKKYNRDISQLSENKDKFWQEKVNQLESSLKYLQENVKETVHADELQKKEEMASLRKAHEQELRKLEEIIDEITKEKEIQQNKYMIDMKEKEETLKFAHEQENKLLLTETENKLDSISQKLKNKFEERKKNMEIMHQNQMDELKQSLDSKLEEEKTNLKNKCQEEIKSILNIYAKRWEDEMEKFCQLHQDEMLKIKECKEKDLEDIVRHIFVRYKDKLKEMQDECESQISKVRMLNSTQQHAELQKVKKVLEERFSKEKERDLEARERRIREELQEKCSKELEAHHEKAADDVKFLEENWRKKLEKQERDLRAWHENEMSRIKQIFEEQLLEQKENLLGLHERELKELEERFTNEFRSTKDAIKNLKESVANKSVKTSSPEVSSGTDDTCSTCVKDLSPSNRELLVQKLLKESNHVLTLTKNQVTQLMEERRVIIKCLKSVSLTEISEDCDLKHVINKFVEEIQNMRKKIENSKQQIVKLNSKNSELVAQLSQHKKLHAELEARLALYMSELDQKNSSGVPLAKNNSQFPADSAKVNDYLVSSSQQDDVLHSTPSEIEAMRSEFHQRSNDFSMSLPHMPKVSEKEDNHNEGNVTDDLEVEQMKRIRNESCASPIIPDMYHNDVLLRKQPLFQAGSVQKKSVQATAEYETKSKNHDAFNHQMDDVSDKGERTWKTSLVKVVSPDSRYSGEIRGTSSTAVKLRHLHLNYQKAQSYRKALIFQKNYLLTLLAKFQATEEIALAMISRMGVSVTTQQDVLCNFAASDKHRRGISLFRSAACVVIALQRMRFLVARWKKIPSLRLPENDFSAFGDTPYHFSAKNSEFLRGHFASLNSTPLSSLSWEDIVGKSISSLPSTGSQSNHQDDELNEGPLYEYVRRIEALHEKFGLTDLRDS